MRKIYVTLMLAGMITLSHAQIKSSGLVNFTSITPMSVKIDVNNTTSQVTMTVTGPADRLFCIGFGSTSMGGTVDTFTNDSATTILDTGGWGGHDPLVADAQQNWTLVSNTVGGAGNLVRTIVTTRALSTGDTNDYTFNYASLTSLSITWAMWRTAGAYQLNGKDSANVNTRHSNSASLTRGGVILNFTTLGLENNELLNQLSVYPNPSNGEFKITKSNQTLISKIRVYDMNAKLLKELDVDSTNQNILVNLTDFSSGIYFMELSNEHDKTVKKIVIK